MIGSKLFQIKRKHIRHVKTQILLKKERKPSADETYISCNTGSSGDYETHVSEMLFSLSGEMSLVNILNMNLVK